ncbi:hypothetical protein [Hymenobacter sp. GOD-10R]|uniref:hypothetical protein n=1 Tax=Hymenobacter sp. GOD-10R TaxID=3093922 RepID=UPI002D791250|nr:hypothetical protein [Hymenobacter sp. GOD-10R]WRQ29377.1 hypothetical protein SD425_03755 [Hymenobacter sp. GOD-10R]
MPLLRLFVFALLLPTVVSAQHMHNATADTSQHGGMHQSGMHMGDSSMAHGDHDMHDMNMSHAYSRYLPMSRNGSGTAWQPDATPMYMWMQHKGPWMLMYHGAVFGRYTNQNIGRKNGQRGGSTLDAPNWFMTMAQRNVGQRGLLNLTLMVSLDPLTEGNNGYPLLFQSGEAYKGNPLVDRQHPHDLFSGLSVGYTHAFSQDVDMTLYLGYPGEPAVGPTAFMHRISAMSNPDAPLSHHWVDATHITFGVATLGVRYKQFKLEGSNFTGREPNEYRYGFDRPRSDSWAARLMWNPTNELSLQIGQAWVKSPEELHADEDVQRTTAGLMHSRQWGDYHYIASSFIWGMNHYAFGNEHAVLAETNIALGKPTVYGRYEFLQKDAEELTVPHTEGTHPIYNVHALTLGASYRLAQLGQHGPELHVGAQGSVYRPDDQLRGYYGKTPVSAQVYLRLNAPLMRMSGMKM